MRSFYLAYSGKGWVRKIKKARGTLRRDCPLLAVLCYKPRDIDEDDTTGAKVRQGFFADLLTFVDGAGKLAA
jgi:hypothetical protein